MIEKLKMSDEQRKRNTKKITDYITKNNLSISSFSRLLGVSWCVIPRFINGKSNCSISTMEKIEECLGCKMEYQIDIPKKKSIKKEASKPSTFIPEHVIPMLRMHGNTVIRNSLIKKHKKEGVLEELKKLGLDNINLERTENNCWILVEHKGEKGHGNKRN